MLIANMQHDTRLKQLVRITKFIPREYRAHEAKLMVAKWPAYRFMSPFEATNVFHSEYREAYRNYHKQNVDLEESKNIKIGEKLSFWKPSAHLTQLWRARQHADELGMPYRTYLRFTFDFASRGKRNHAPQPNQLRPSPKAHDAWYCKLAEFWTSEYHLTELGRIEPMGQYAVENDKGLPAQRQFRSDLVESLKLHKGPLDFLLGKYVYALRYLRLEDFAPIGASAVELAAKRVHLEREAGEHVPKDYGKLKRSAFFQSCFGLPGISADDPVCGSCPHRKECSFVRSKVTERVEAKTGSADPLEEKKRLATRKRVARHRARQREKELAKRAGRCRRPEG